MNKLLLKFMVVSLLCLPLAACSDDNKGTDEPQKNTLSLGTYEVNLENKDLEDEENIVTHEVKVNTNADSYTISEYDAEWFTIDKKEDRFFVTLKEALEDEEEELVEKITVSAGTADPKTLTITFVPDEVDKILEISFTIEGDRDITFPYTNNLQVIEYETDVAVDLITEAILIRRIDGSVKPGEEGSGEIDITGISLKFVEVSEGEIQLIANVSNYTNKEDERFTVYEFYPGEGYEFDPLTFKITQTPMPNLSDFGGYYKLSFTDLLRDELVNSGNWASVADPYDQPWYTPSAEEPVKFAGSDETGFFYTITVPTWSQSGKHDSYPKFDVSQGAPRTIYFDHSDDHENLLFRQNTELRSTMDKAFMAYEYEDAFWSPGTWTPKSSEFAYYQRIKILSSNGTMTDAPMEMFLFLEEEVRGLEYPTWILTVPEEFESVVGDGEIVIEHILPDLDGFPALTRFKDFKIIMFDRKDHPNYNPGGGGIDPL